MMQRYRHGVFIIFLYAAALTSSADRAIACALSTEFPAATPSASCLQMGQMPIQIAQAADAKDESLLIFDLNYIRQQRRIEREQREYRLRQSRLLQQQNARTNKQLSLQRTLQQNQRQISRDHRVDQETRASTLRQDSEQRQKDLQIDQRNLLDAKLQQQKEIIQTQDRQNRQQLIDLEQQQADLARQIDLRQTTLEQQQKSLSQSNKRQQTEQVRQQKRISEDHKNTQYQQESERLASLREQQNKLKQQLIAEQQRLTSTSRSVSQQQSLNQQNSLEPQAFLVRQQAIQLREIKLAQERLQRSQLNLHRSIQGKHNRY